MGRTSAGAIHCAHRLESVGRRPGSIAHLGSCAARRNSSEVQCIYRAARALVLMCGRRDASTPVIGGSPVTEAHTGCANTLPLSVLAPQTIWLDAQFLLCTEIGKPLIEANALLATWY
jgi:hypothetical protein